MDATYPYRRKLVNDNSDISEIKEAYRAPFTIQEVYREFTRLTCIDLDALLLKQLPSMAAKMVAHATRKNKKSRYITRLLAEFER